jgi:hypothetical protein
MSARLSKARTWSSSNAQQQQQQPQIISGDERLRRPAEHKDLPPAYTSPSTTTATSINTLQTHVTSVTRNTGPAPDPEPAIVAPTFLQPRVAAVLGVSRPWHPVLFLLRLFSIMPTIYLGFPVAIRGLLMLHGMFTRLEGEEAPEAGRGGAAPGDDKLLLTETILALMWCGCSGYLSFYFTDCLMSRW